MHGRRRHPPRFPRGPTRVHGRRRPPPPPCPTGPKGQDGKEGEGQGRQSGSRHRQGQGHPGAVPGQVLVVLAREEDLLRPPHLLVPVRTDLRPLPRLLSRAGLHRRVRGRQMIPPTRHHTVVPVPAAEGHEVEQFSAAGSASLQAPMPTANPRGGTGNMPRSPLGEPAIVWRRRPPRGGPASRWRRRGFLHTG